MRAAIEPARIGYVKARTAHRRLPATKAERERAESVLWRCRKPVMVSSTKSMTGHLLGAASW
ncbi:hypothetical protein KCP74_20660 [Salmonella enterica subsp. enterica]|nr:hypothetical protein KCP74_20660 [Salmonella enterica subsp. enterica]